ncbi:type II secretion system minor pseudopilin GspJ [Chitinimonas sp. BJB300]|uniref:type II secretion system minor pseudopilin GspJ n=1 Tax=Chitinimonas sp. BJB300 TaxID=1559339 RepID=UPI000C118169|nr:type II secretion system minor pseudopilin GspJ [Chitinimonas sp. BJB300]PHV11717.1 type II secretion system protein GspJ [Chitinimonas sp. BJB300]TSJ89994.1 type II secretion system protein GspJ [Chitinimonas sp. BJB300]
MRRIDSLRREGGFTLIEILIALAVFSVLAVIAYQGVARMATTKLVLDADNRKWRELTVALARFDEDFSQVANRQWMDEGGIAQSPVRGSAGSIDANGAQLELVRFDAGQLIHLGYRLREGTLELLLWPSLDLAPRSAPTALPLLEKVSQFQVRFLDDNTQWQLAWPQGSKNDKLPRGVEMVLTLQSGEIITRLFILP